MAAPAKETEARISPPVIEWLAMYIHEGNDWSIQIPSEVFASESLTLEQKGDANLQELYAVMQKVALYWEKCNVTNYLFFTSSVERAWHLIPTEGQNDSLWDRAKSVFRQSMILARVTFGKFSTSETDRNLLFSKYAKFSEIPAAIFAENQTTQSNDAFCTEKVIQSQQIWEGTHARVLYNYAPLGKEGLHFLIVPKTHKERFTELSQVEFVEIQQLAASLIAKFPTYEYFQYSKTGLLAGQTVPHFHEHLVFVLPQDTFTAKLSALFRMIVPQSPLKPADLAERVQKFQSIMSTE